MPEFFHLDRTKLFQEYKEADTDTLQKLEVALTRSSMANTGSAALGAAATVKTFGAALPLPIYSARMAYIAEEKLEMVQLQLTSRSIQLHSATWIDATHALGSLAAGQVVGGLFDVDASGVEEVVNEHPGGEEVQAEVLKAVPGEVAQAAYLAATNEPPPKTCPRPKRYRFQRLKCAACEKCFDTSYSEWVHCCQCKERFDLCESCSKTTRHNPGHKLYKMKGEYPKSQTSIRGVFGISVRCGACNKKMSGEIYTCEDCTGSCDICLSCYAEGYWCGKHTDPLCRQHL